MRASVSGAPTCLQINARVSKGGVERAVSILLIAESTLLDHAAESATSLTFLYSTALCLPSGRCQPLRYAKKISA